jgi:phosphatidate cytidylyltransferase
VLKYRLLLGPVFIAALIGMVWLDEALEARVGVPALVLLPVTLIVGVLATQELVVMLHRRSILVGPRLTAVAVSIGIIASSFVENEHQGVSGIALVCTAAVTVLLLAFFYYARHQSAEGVAAAAAGTLMAFVYLGIMGGFLIALRKEHTGWLVLVIVLVTKSYDIGAFFTGRAIGRHKLIQWLSPGKTWEGFIGGLVVSSLVGVGAIWATQSAGRSVAPDVSVSVWQAAVIGLLFGLMAQAGDLVASLLKRDAGLKDSSGALPGFGGVLDVIDSPLVVAPVAYWVFWVLEAWPGHAIGP